MRRLSPAQPVVLDLAEEAIECVVEAAAGDEATLRPLAAADAGYIPRLGRAAALVFAVGGRRGRVEGAVQRAEAEGMLRFLGGGGAGLPAPRPAARAPRAARTPRAAPGAPPPRRGPPDVTLGGVGVRADDWAPAIGAT